MDPNQPQGRGQMGYPVPPYYYQQPPPQMNYYMNKRPNEGYGGGYRQTGAPSSHYPPMPGYTKIYLGQLPLHITKEDIEEVFHEYCELGELKIVTGNSQGEFTRTCYAFLDLKGNESFCAEVIRKVQQRHPNWKINLRSEYDRGSKPPRDAPSSSSSYPTSSSTYPSSSSYPNKDYSPNPPSSYRPAPSSSPPHSYYQGASSQQLSPPPVQPNFNNRLLADYSGGERGKKSHKIMVRELWIGGTPEGISENQLREIMSHFGMVEKVEIFSKFAFVKYRMVIDATNAFEKAARIHEMFGKHPGFRISFSDPKKRPYIVGNHDEYDRQSSYLPILFLGFHPITSSIVDQNHMKSICQKYGPIVNTYIRKSQSPQMRSYILLTFDSVRSAMKAKMELSKRKDLLGDKRVQLALLLDEEVIMKGRNFDYTIQKYQGDSNIYDKRFQKSGPMPAYNPNTFQPMPAGGMQSGYPPYQGYPPNYMPGPMPMMGMHPSQMGQMGMMPYYPMMPMMSMPQGSIGSQSTQPSTTKSTVSSSFPAYPSDQGQPYQQPEDMYNLMQNVLKKDKKDQQGQLQPPTPKQRQRQPDWSGFLLRNKILKVGIDGFAKTPNFNFQDSLINISHLIKLSESGVLKNRRQVLLVEPTNEISKKAFQQYVVLLKKKQSMGVAVSYKQLLFVLPHCPEADEICPGMTDNQLLVVMEDVHLFHELKDKLEKCQQTSNKIQKPQSV